MVCARHHKPQHQLPLRQRLHRRHRSCTCPSSTPFWTQFFKQFCPTGKDLAFVTCSGPDMMFPKGSPAVWEIDSLEGTWFRKYKIVQIRLRLLLLTVFFQQTICAGRSVWRAELTWTMNNDIHSPYVLIKPVMWGKVVNMNSDQPHDYLACL